MSCYLCSEEADALCKCSDALICDDHFSRHKRENQGKHFSEPLEEVSSEQLCALRAEILGRLKQLERAKMQLSAQKRTLVSERKRSGNPTQVKQSMIELKLLEVSVGKKINLLIQRYTGLASQREFSLSQREKIKFIMDSCLLMKEVSLVNISQAGEVSFENLFLEKPKAEIREERKKQLEEEERKKKLEEEERKKQFEREERRKQLEETERRKQLEEEEKKIISEEFKSKKYLERLSGMSLKDRVDYFNGMNLSGWKQDINYNYRATKELLVTNDMSHLFFCI